MKTMEYKKFDNELEARCYRDTQRDNKYASSLFKYGNNRYMVHTSFTCIRGGDLSATQRWLTSRAWNHDDKLKELTTLKEMIDRQSFADFYTVIETTEDALTFIKPLKEWGWFQKAYEIIDFLERPDDFLPKIKEYIEDELNEYDVEWEELK